MATISTRPFKIGTSPNSSQALMPITSTLTSPSTGGTLHELRQSARIRVQQAGQDFGSDRGSGDLEQAKSLPFLTARNIPRCFFNLRNFLGFSQIGESAQKPLQPPRNRIN